MIGEDNDNEVFFNTSQCLDNSETFRQEDDYDASEGEEAEGGNSVGSSMQNIVLSGSEKGNPHLKRKTVLREQNSRAQKRYRERQTLHRQSMEVELSKLRGNAERLLVTQKANVELRNQITKYEQIVNQYTNTINDLRRRESSNVSDRTYALSEMGEASKKADQINQLQKRWLIQLNRLTTAVTSGLERETSGYVHMMAEGREMLAQLERTQHIGPAWFNSLLPADLPIPHCFLQGDVSSWRSLTQSLELSSDQIHELKEMRMEDVVKLDSLYVVRRMLTQQIMTLCNVWRDIMMEFTAYTESDKLKLVQRLSNIGQEGVCVLDALKDNLISEQHALVVFNTRYIRKVLRPEQAMRFLMESNPHSVHHFQSAGLKI
mmetsp:Transcript_39881/g.55425  ORF Transcript_39881/g.55425 Transcript_39881/m.55425 type:complete len:376 (-) Transcript_39881:166-1293(-)|eukprot:CAMPEP_0196587778 /NCGR_PEP_ID=MMETSP1081-20130531/58563_1 /TAXON_ID=36882 /ORGANISM="Pyramimonas amylifera, Strain CCMP720" /LENGTH=375 /DNA_ID=CAMNT_0041910059 /DNA_START=48 /DNA_END=1175 /DNA_ORIENTATION=-